MDPTIKQIQFAKKLGISNPETYSKEVLSKLIDERTGKTQPQATQTQNTPTPATSIVINKVEKPHSYEFGPASNRHKIYYGTIAELTEQLDWLKNAGLMAPADLEDE